MDKYILAWCLFCFLTLLFITNKKVVLGELGAQYIMWFFSPIIFVFYIIGAYFQRKQLKWLKKNWFYIASNIVLQTLMNKQKTKKIRHGK